MKIFVIGDMHGAHRALMQCLERSNFNYSKDKLIILGDVADGWTQVYECFEELFKIKNLVYVRGNHDQWLKQWLHKGDTPNVWTMQGGQNTLNSYKGRSDDDKKRHLDFLKKTPCYYVDENNRCFIHGGIPNNGKPLEEQSKQDLMWNRDMWELRNTLQGEVHGFKEIYLGHTSIYLESHKPITNANVTFMDTGAGWEGVLSMMNVESKELFQSDKVSDLYPEAQGRN